MGVKTTTAAITTKTLFILLLYRPSHCNGIKRISISICHGAFRRSTVQ